MITEKAPIVYKIPMTGTTLEVTAAMRLIPPIITKPNNAARTNPVIHIGRPKELSIPDAKLLDCGRFPEPIELITVATAKNIASHFIFKPCSM